MFRAEGFERVTVNDIPAAADVSRGTFLRHFSSKEDAVLGVLGAQGDRLAVHAAATRCSCGEAPRRWNRCGRGACGTADRPRTPRRTKSGLRYLHRALDATFLAHSTQLRRGVISGQSRSGKR
nr:helix-turn-helix domain-containing protein [Pseudofrankia sp. BMG5.36]